jgi:hypothetical protein
MWKMFYFSPPISGRQSVGMSAAAPTNISHTAPTVQTANYRWSSLVPARQPVQSRQQVICHQVMFSQEELF